MEVISLLDLHLRLFEMLSERYFGRASNSLQTRIFDRVRCGFLHTQNRPSSSFSVFGHWNVLLNGKVNRSETLPEIAPRRAL